MRYKIDSAKKLEQVVQKFGFLPFFKNDVKGFSVEEMTPPELWFSDTLPGPWEWKGPVAKNGKCIYGKLFQKKAGFVSLDLLPDFLNYRRDGYDFDSRYEEGLAAKKDKNVYDVLTEHKTLITPTLKKLCNYCKDGSKGFETVITRLQMQGYVVIADFEYMKDKYGKEYGWGVSKYSTPENLFGEELATSAYIKEPEESEKIIMDFLKGVLPKADEKALMSLLKR